jgi:uncharacterized protein
MITATVEDTTPWYRQKWPRLIMVPPVSAIIGCAITITLAIRSADGMVAADYYKRGLAINEQLARSQFAQKIGLHAEISVRGVATGDEVKVQLRADEALPAEATVKMRLVHPGRDDSDRHVILARSAVHEDGRVVDLTGQWGEVEPLGGVVNWRLVLEARDWRLDGDGSMIGTGRPIKINAVQP